MLNWARQTKTGQDPQQAEVGGGNSVGAPMGGVSVKSLVGEQGGGEGQPPRVCSTGWGSQSLGRTHSRRRWVGVVLMEGGGGNCKTLWGQQRGGGSQLGGAAEARAGPTADAGGWGC